MNIATIKVRSIAIHSADTEHVDACWYLVTVKGDGVEYRDAVFAHIIPALTWGRDQAARMVVK